MGASPAPGGIKAILGNSVMTNRTPMAVRLTAKSVPDGAVMAKVEWAKKNSPGPPYAVMVPERLNEVSFMVKDSKRFSHKNGWGYATFKRAEASGAWNPFHDGPAFANKCHGCHTHVKARDSVYANTLTGELT
jgi:hypothetical protein